MLAKWPVDFEMGRKIYLLGLHVIVKIPILLRVLGPAQCCYKVGAVRLCKVGAVATQQGFEEMWQEPHSPSNPSLHPIGMQGTPNSCEACEAFGVQGRKPP